VGKNSGSPVRIRAGFVMRSGSGGAAKPKVNLGWLKVASPIFKKKNIQTDSHGFRMNEVYKGKHYFWFWIKGRRVKYNNVKNTSDYVEKLGSFTVKSMKFRAPKEKEQNTCFQVTDTNNRVFYLCSTKTQKKKAIACKLRTHLKKNWMKKERNRKVKKVSTLL